MFKNAKINTQLTACVLVMLALATTMGLLSLQLGNALTSAIRINGSRQILAGQLRSGAAEMQGSARGLALAAALSDTDEAGQLKSRLQLAADSVGKSIDQLLISTQDAGMLAELAALQRDFKPLRANSDQMLALMNDHKIDQAMSFFSQTMLPQMKRLSENSEKLMARESGAFDQAVTEASAQKSRGQWLTILLLLCSTAAGGLVIVFVRRISGRLQSLAFELRQAATQLRGSSSRVASASSSLVDGANRQSASVQETSASTEELTATTQQNAQISLEMAERMRGTDRVVADGNGALQDMTDAMREINSSSERIRKIIKVIDEIAFQTNILALNAAVEAARAGAAGLGFAVVADEVRNLAHRSATAAHETAQLIEESTLKSAEGGTKLERVTQAMGGITTASAEVRTMAERLTGSSQEQARGIQQIGQALHQIEQVTQSSVLAANDSAEAGIQMVNHAESLGDMVLALVSMVGEPAREPAGQEKRSAVTRRYGNEE